MDVDVKLCMTEGKKKNIHRNSADMTEEVSYFERRARG